jgi:drug/metabolite transporter (DMT)-like permease
MDRRSWLWLLLLGAIWGSSYLFIKIGLRDLSPAMVAWSRIALAAMVLMPLALSRGAFAGLGSRLPLLTLLGAVQVAGPFLLISAGEEEISSSLAGILVSSTPLFTALLAVWVDHEERSSGLRMVGVMAGFAGVAVLLGGDLSGSSAALLGGMAVVLASLGYAIGGFLFKHRFADLQPIGVVAAVMTASALLLAPLGILTAPAAVPDLGPLAAVAALGVVGTGVAFVIFYALIGTVGPARTMLVSYIAPGFAVIYGATLLDETISAAVVVGLVLIVGGSWLAAEGRVPGRPLRVAAQRPSAGAVALAGSAPRHARRAAPRVSPELGHSRSARPTRADPADS